MLKRAVSCVVSTAMCRCLTQPAALADEVAGSDVQGDEGVVDEEGADELTVAADGDIELLPISFPSSPSSDTDDPTTDNDISKIATVTIAKQTYTGKPIKPVLVMKKGAKKPAKSYKGAKRPSRWRCSSRRSSCGFCGAEQGHRGVFGGPSLCLLL